MVVGRVVKMEFLRDVLVVVCRGEWLSGDGRGVSLLGYWIVINV